MKKLKSQLLQELKRDKKRATVLAALVVIGLLVFGRLILKQIGSAAAKDSAPSTASPSSDPSTPDWASGSGRRETSRDDYLTQIDTTITRDIFAPPELHFPPVEVSEKSIAVVDARAVERVERETVQKEAAAMTVESTILSSIPKAIINGQLVQVGDTLNGFRIVEIGSRSVTLERDGVTVILEMKSER